MMSTHFFTRKKAMMLMILAEILAITIWFIYAIRSEHTTRYELSGDEMSFAADDAPEDFLHDGLGNQINGQSDVGTNRRIVSPSVSIDKGVYQVDVQFSTSTAITSTTGTHIAAYDASDSMYPSVKSEQTKLFGDRTNTSFLVHVSEDTPIVFRAIMDDGSPDTITVDEIVITRLALRSVLPSLVLAVVIFSILDSLAFLALFWKDSCMVFFRKRSVHIAAIVFISILTSIPLFAGGLLTGYDQRFHYYRVFALASGLRSSGFPSMIYPEYANGYGYANGIFYPDIFLYLPAMLYLIGIRMETAYKIFIFVINIFTAVISYFSFKKLSGNRDLGVVGMAIYTMALPRLVALYTRGAIAAACAYCFAPLFLLGLYLMFSDDESRDDAYLYLAIGISGIISSHVLGSVMAVAFAAIYVLLHFKKLLKPVIWVQLLKAVTITLVLTAWFLIPFIPTYLKTNLMIKHTENDIARFAAYPAQLFSNSFNIIGDTREDLNGMHNDMPMSLGLASLLLLMIMAAYMLRAKKNPSSERTEFYRLSGVLGISLFAATTLFPYKWLYHHAGRIYRAVATFQFAYRFLAPAICILTVMAVVALKIAGKENPRYRKWIYAGGAFIASMFVLQGTTALLDYSNEMPVFAYNDSFRELDYSALYTKEYLPAGFELQDTPATLSLDALTEAGGSASIVFRDGNHIRIFADNPSDTVQEVAFPLLFYPGYGAKAEGKKLEVFSGVNCRASVRIPAHFEGTVELRATAYMSWRFSYLVSLIGIIGLISLVIEKKVWKRWGLSPKVGPVLEYSND